MPDVSGRFEEKINEEAAGREKAAEGAQKTGDTLMGGADLIANAIDILTAYITDGAQGVRSAIASLVSSLISQFIPGPIGGALGRLFGALFGRKRTAPQKVTVENTVRTFPVNLQMPYAQNPASALFGGRGQFTGAGVMVEIRYRDGAEDMVAARVSAGLSNLIAMEAG